MTSRKKIQQIALGLLGEDLSLPVKVDKIIRKQGIKLIPYEMGDDVSGILIIEHNNSTIGYDKNESKVRQRFTMAHELGHFMLHKDGELFVDKGFKTMYRPSSNTPSDQWQEWEANEFAACLLMPQNLLEEEFKKLEVDYEDDSWIKKLADDFQVSLSAMSIRLSRLGLK